MTPLTEANIVDGCRREAAVIFKDIEMRRAQFEAISAMLALAAGLLSAAPAAAQDVASAARLEAADVVEIIVTAQKREQSLNDVGLSITFAFR